ncbi:WD repeat-containing protein 97 [Saccopteryx bilineata]|uniref:WD repeat-containing protein 97 n=1 Tax=Saccopteryx bilineata TaxID=59482 RepID=UPI00338F05CD
METDVLDADNPFSVESDNLTLDPDIYDADSYSIPDPGLLKEKNERSSSEPVSQLFTGSSPWQNMTATTRARQLWLLLRISLHSFVEKEKKSELRVARMTHGLEPLRRLEVAAGLCSVAQDPVGQRFVVLDGAGHLHLHREDGWPHEKLLSPVALTGLVALLGPLGSGGRFVGWGPTKLAILRPDLSLLWLSEPGVVRALHGEPICCLPVPDLGLLIVAEKGGGLALWKFHLGGHCLMPHGSPLQPPPSCTHALERLALGPLAPQHAPHCFAAYGSTVLTFDLHTWAITDVRRDLHKTIISDLVYCGEAEAMVTASRDSTVKVWEADWQIRMVFVGHTGPVTALAVLPNTSLVLSASQDGTLRTWDLQAEAQVGEVTLSCWGQGVQSGHVNRLLAPAGPGWPVLSLHSGSVELWRLRELYSPLAQLSAPVCHLQVAPALHLPPHTPLPKRLVCACTDGSVYLVSAVTGRTVSALLLEPEDCAAAVAYCLPREALWLLTRTGHLVSANAARCPMRVLNRVRPPPPPAPRPCCLHLYSHLTNPSSAFASWEIVRQRGGELGPSNIPAWKDKNRYLPVVGQTDGTLAVLEWHTLKTVFQTEAHSPGPVNAIAATWNSIVSSGGDLTVKMWRVFPYAEESLSLLRTFSCCHPAPVLCALGKWVTVGFEDADSATYGLVQFNLNSRERYDHRPQDDPTDHITGLCCCPTLKLYASSSLDCTIRIWTADNRLLRLMQLNGAPQALTFCNNSGDLVLALGSRLCLVSHRLYLPTAYLVKKLCQRVPDVVDDPPLPLTNRESLTSAQLQRLANLHGVASLSTALSSIHGQTAAPQQPLLEEDMEAFVARNQDLQQLRLEQVVPAAQPPPSWQQQQEAFDNYLHLIYGPALGMPSGTESQQWNTMTLTAERETWDGCTLPRAAPTLGVRTEAPTAPKALPPSQDSGALGQRFARPPQVTLPIQPIHRWVHSRASQLLACSSLSSSLGLSLDLQLQSEQLCQERPVAQEPPPASHLRHRVPLLLERRPRELLSNLRGFFPATLQPYKDLLRPIHFPGWVPNSVVLQQMWLSGEDSGLGVLAQLTSQGSLEPGEPRDSLWWLPSRRHHTNWRKLLQLLGKKGNEDKDEVEDEEEDEDEDEELDLDWASDSLSPQMELSPELPGSKEPSAQSSESRARRSSADDTARMEAYLGSRRYQHGLSLWEEQCDQLPQFLHFFVIQNWFKKLFPIFTLEAYPEVGTVDGLASRFTDLLEEASWEDRVHILRALLSLMPDVSRELCGRLHGILVHLLNLDPPPSLQDRIEKQFVMLALQLLLACSLDSRVVVLELMSYFLYSPDDCWPELKKLLERLGLQDPEGLCKEMMTWVRDLDLGLGSKAALRSCCDQKLEELINHLQRGRRAMRPLGSQLTLALRHLSSRAPASLRHLPAPSWMGVHSRVQLGSRNSILHWSPPPQVETLQRSAAKSKLSKVLLTVSETSELPPLSEGARALTSTVSGAPVHVSARPLARSWMPSPVASPGEPGSAAWESRPVRRTRRALSEILLPFSSLPEVYPRLSAPDRLLGHLLPLEEMEWSQSKILDMVPIDALNFFCEQQRARRPSSLQEEPESLRLSPRSPVRNAVLPQPSPPWTDPILRLQETKIQRAPMRQKGQMLSRRWEGRTLVGSIRTLKLPLPRVELQPFPLGWPRPARPLPPLLLQPALQRYFLPDRADPDNSN